MTHSARRKQATANDSCGCAMGARFLGVALILSVAHFAWHFREFSLTRASLYTLGLSFAAATLGKLVGIGTYYMRTRAVRP